MDDSTALFHFDEQDRFVAADGREVALIITAAPQNIAGPIHIFESREFDFTVYSGGRQWWGEILTVVAVPADSINPRAMFGENALLGTVTPKKNQLPMHMPDSLAKELRALTTGHQWRF